MAGGVGTGEKCSKKAMDTCQRVKRVLKVKLEMFHLDPNKPFFLFQIKPHMADAIAVLHHFRGDTATRV